MKRIDAKTLYPIISILSWLINPWLSFATSSVLLLKINRKWPYLLLASLIVSTVCLYQLVLPLPIDLIQTKHIYLYKSFNMSLEWAMAWVIRDPLSYGLLNILSYFFPNYPITFYLLNILLGFTSLWFIFSYHENIELDPKIKLALFIGLFFCVIDYHESHHFLRQTTALLIMLYGFFSKGKRQIIIFLFSLLWHGSVILFIPIALLSTVLKNKKSWLIFLLLTLLLSTFLGGLNIYEYLKTQSIGGQDFFSFRLIDRFLIYFRDPKHANYFNASVEAGNDTLLLYLVPGFITFFYALKKNLFVSKVSPLIWCSLIFLVLFRHHVILFPRIAYAFTLFLMMFWIMQIPALKFRSSSYNLGLISLVTIFKIFVFTWPFSTMVKEKHLISLSPIQIIQESTLNSINEHDYPASQKELEDRKNQKQLR